MIERITSVHNPKVRNALTLQAKSRERRKQKLMVIEGLREITRAIQSGYILKELFVYPGLEKNYQSDQVDLLTSGYPVFEISLPVFNKLAYREGSDGFIAIAEFSELTLDDLKLSNNPLLVILDSVEKPGNLGAVMRTADAASVDGVIICDPLTDIFNPNIIRSSIGCIFSVPVVTASATQVQKWLIQHKIEAYAAALYDNAVSYHVLKYSGPTAFVMGTESTGLSESWLEFCNSKIIIPMKGVADSLNVSVSTAILVFEALRQRNFGLKFQINHKTAK
jgi:RNA methyltransferase, TrmH family